MAHADLATTMFVSSLITETTSVPSLVTYIMPVTRSAANPTGTPPTGMVATTVLVCPSITDTVALLVLATLILPARWSTATPRGRRRTATVATTVLLCPFTTDTEWPWRWPHKRCW
jgi:hypothetical protein